MSLPTDRVKTSLLISERANYLGHNAKRAQGQRWTNSIVGLSALLGVVAGSTGLADLVSKTWVSIIALAAAASSTVAISLLQTSKSDAHQRAQAKYEDLYQRTGECDINAPGGEALFDRLYEEFRDIVKEVNEKDHASLKNWQTKRFWKKAKNQIKEERQGVQEIDKPLPMPPPYSWRDLPPQEEHPPLQAGT